MSRRGLMRPAIIKTTRQDKQHYQLTTTNIIYFQNSMSTDTEQLKDFVNYFVQTEYFLLIQNN